MDTKRCKAISTRDFKIALKAFGLELPRGEYIQLLLSIEKDNKGLIKEEIFIKEIRKLLSNRDTRNEMVKLFRLIDEDDKGKIGFDDLKQMATMLGEQVSDQEIIAMLNAADDDGDGQVNLMEFLKLMDRARKVL